MIKVKSIIITVFCAGQFLWAGTPHTATGQVKDYDGSTPGNSNVTFNTYITTRSGEVQTQNSTGAGYSGGYWYINVGNFPTEWSVGEVLRVDANNLATGESQSITMTLTASDPDIGPNLVFPEPGVPDISISPSSKDYGNVSLGSNGTQFFIVSNDGTDDLSVSSSSITGSNPGHFSITSGGGSFTLSPGATRSINVKFAPTTLSSKTAKLRIASDDPDENPLDAWLEGVGIGEPDIDVSPSSRNYGSIYTGSGKTRSFTVTNTGNIDLHVSSTSLTGGQSGDYSITSGGGSFTLSPGSNRTIQIRFSPSTTGSRSTTFRINSDDPDENPKDVSLTGQGLSEPDIDISPGSKDFGDIYIGESASVTLQVRNTGNESLSVSSTSLIGTDHARFTMTSGGGSFSLSPGASKNIHIQFSPGSVGSKSAKLRINNNDPNEDPKDANLSGTGIALPPPDIDVQPTQIDYGEITVDTTAAQTISIANQSTHLDLNIESITIIGKDSTSFKLNVESSFSISPGGTQDIELVFNPLSMGQKTADVRIISNDPDEATVMIPLTGDGIPVPVPNLSVYPEPVNFNNVLLDSGKTLTINLLNNGSQPLIIESLSLSGSDTSQFQLMSDSSSYTIQSNDDRKIQLSFIPNLIGNKSIFLNIVSNDPDEGDKPILISGKCIGLPLLVIIPDSYDFGNVEVDSQKVQTFQMNNIGTDTLKIHELIIPGDDSLTFAIEISDPYYILPGDSKSVVLSFAPRVIGDYDVELQCQSNDYLTAQYDIPIYGTGIVTISEMINLKYCYPSNNASGVPTTTRIQFKLESDPRIGINYDKLSIYINNTPVYLNGEDKKMGKITLKKYFSSCRFYFEPFINYSKNGEVSVRVSCEDNNPIPHVLDSTYTFTTGQGPTSLSQIYTIDPSGGQLQHDSLGIIISFPQNAVSDTTEIEIALMQKLPEFPDSIKGIGLGLYFGPDGLQFNQLVTISIPIPESLDPSLLDSLIQHGIYYWDSVLENGID